jgi:hypothetical protein
VKAYQVVGLDWTMTERYDIIAALPEGATTAQLPEMFLALLEDRFGFKAHKSQKEFSVYTLERGEDASHLVWWGNPTDIPVMGDWNGDGRLKIGVYRDGFWIIDWNGNYQWDDQDSAHSFWWGYAGDRPVVGDWNSDGHLKIGIYRDGLCGSWSGSWGSSRQASAKRTGQPAVEYSRWKSYLPVRPVIFQQEP